MIKERRDDYQSPRLDVFNIELGEMLAGSAPMSEINNSVETGGFILNGGTEEGGNYYDDPWV